MPSNRLHPGHLSEAEPPANAGNDDGQPDMEAAAGAIGRTHHAAVPGAVGWIFVAHLRLEDLRTRLAQ
jgi:hypothetical protein